MDTISCIIQICLKVLTPFVDSANKPTECCREGCSNPIFVQPLPKGACRKMHKGWAEQHLTPGTYKVNVCTPVSCIFCSIRQQTDPALWKAPATHLVDGRYGMSIFQWEAGEQGTPTANLRNPCGHHLWTHPAVGHPPEVWMPRTTEILTPNHHYYKHSWLSSQCGCTN